MKDINLQDYIEDIELNGLRGRMVDIPATDATYKNLNLLFFHGHHSSIERMEGIAKMMSRHGNFCMPDLPGFGGMDPFYKIGLKPNIDDFADYMAAFIKMHYGKQKKFVAIGYSFGFLILTRMLQKYPELQAQVLDVVCVAGFVHGDAFQFTKKRKFLYTTLVYAMRCRPMAFVAREVFMRRWFIGGAHASTRNAKIKYEGSSEDEYRRMIDMEVALWRNNDVRTRAHTVLQMFHANLLKDAARIHKPVAFVIVDGDHYFKNDLTENQLRQLYDDVKVYTLNTAKHGMSVVASEEEARQFFPQKITARLKKLK